SAQGKHEHPRPAYQAHGQGDGDQGVIRLKRLWDTIPIVSARRGKTRLESYPTTDSASTPGVPPPGVVMYTVLMPPTNLDRLNRRVTACRACPRLVAWRGEVACAKRAAFRD